MAINTAIEQDKVLADIAKGSEVSLEVYNETKRHIADFVSRMFSETVDDECVAMMVCHNALKNLNRVSQVRVLGYLMKRTEQEIQTEQDALTHVYEGLKKNLDAYINDLRTADKEAVEKWRAERNAELEAATPEQREELLIKMEQGLANTQNYEQPTKMVQ